MSMIKFSKDFYWGGAISALQVESTKNLKSDTNWDVFYRKNPKGFFKEIGPNNTCDHLEHYEEDFEKFREVGCNSFRTSFMWTRLYPEQGKLDLDALKKYNEYVDCAIKNNLKVFLCLNHFELPEWASKKGGFTNPEIVDEFVKYGELVISQFGEKIEYIATFNEPIVPIVHGYLSDLHPPSIHDPKLAVQAAYGMIVSHAKLSKIFYDKYKSKFPNLKFGVILNISPSIPLDGINYSQEDLKAAKIHDMLLNHSMMYSMIKGEIKKELVDFLNEWNLLPKYTEEEIKVIKETKIDMLGINFYNPLRVSKPNGKSDKFLYNFYLPYNWDKARINVFRGWEIRPESLYDLANIIKNDFNNIPFFVSENGMGVENEHLYKNENNQIQDNYRIAFISEHLDWLNKAIQEGSNCCGYHLWSILDNWSFRNAFKNRYGLIEMDPETKKRTIKKSGEWFKKLTENNGFESNYKKIEETIDLKKVEYTRSYVD